MLEGVALFNGAIISNYCSSRKTNSAVQQMLTLKGLHMITRITEVVSGNLKHGNRIRNKLYRIHNTALNNQQSLHFT